MREGNWALARDSFAAADTAEAFEGLSWAAWWLDDAETVFSARERAFRLYLERGEPAAAARMATWIGADQNDFHGAAAVAAGWFERAQRLLAPLPAGPDHGWLAFHVGYVRHAAGDGEPARAGRAKRLTSAAASACRTSRCSGWRSRARRSSPARAWGRACGAWTRRPRPRSTAAPRSRSPARGCAASRLHLPVVYDFERAFAWSDRIAAFADRYGSRWMLAFCRAEYGAVHRWRGRWAEAEALLEASIDDFAHSRPAWAPGPLTGLAELRRRQGRTTEALALLDRAGATAHLTHAQIALDRGDRAPPPSSPNASCAAPDAERRLDRVGPLDVSARAARRPRGDRAEGAGRARGTAPLKAIADRAEGVARGDRALLEDAVDGFAHAPYEAAQARLDLARVLERAGRARAAAREREAANRVLRELGAGRPPLPELTPREREVLTLLARGLTNRQLAERLVVSEHTVHRHVTNILRKLDAPSRAAAAALAARHGLDIAIGRCAPPRAGVASADEHRLGPWGLPPLRHPR